MPSSTVGTQILFSTFCHPLLTFSCLSSLSYDRKKLQEPLRKELWVCQNLGPRQAPPLLLSISPTPNGILVIHKNWEAVIFKNRFNRRRNPLNGKDITLPTKVRLVKAMVFSVVMYGWESWTIKKAEHWRIMVLNCGAGEDSWESLGLQGDPTSPS